MKFYLFDIQDNKIDESNGEVAGIGPEFRHYTDKSFGLEEIYYKVNNGKVVEIICEASDERSAEKSVKEFLANLS